MPALNNSSVQLAQEYWIENPHVSGGVVVLYNGEACGWINQVRNPESWRPGCVAVDEHGNQWEAQGGTDQNGAERWEPVAIEYNGGPVMRRLCNIIQMRKRTKPTLRETRGPIIDDLLIWGKKHDVSTRALTELVLVLGEHGVDFKRPN